MPTIEIDEQCVCARCGLPATRAEGGRLLCSDNCAAYMRALGTLERLNYLAGNEGLGSPAARHLLTDLRVTAQTLKPINGRPICAECWMPLNGQPRCSTVGHDDDSQTWIEGVLVQTDEEVADGDR